MKQILQETVDGDRMTMHHGNKALVLTSMVAVALLYFVAVFLFNRNFILFSNKTQFSCMGQCGCGCFSNSFSCRNTC
jgi:hypothetical protein